MLERLSGGDVHQGEPVEAEVGEETAASRNPRLSMKNAANVSDTRPKH